MIICILILNLVVLTRAYLYTSGPTSISNQLELDCENGDGKCEFYLKSRHGVANGVRIDAKNGHSNANNNNDNDNNDNNNNKMDDETLLLRAQHRIVAPPIQEQQHLVRRENATIVTLARNEDLAGLLTSITQLEDRFNSKFHYDWVFLNDEPFSQQFIQSTSALVSGTPKYGTIGSNNWGYPDWIDQQRAATTRVAMSNVVYGDSESYRHMCRYESGFFFDHPLLRDYRYYWRVEPDVSFHCDINYDVFKFMHDSNKKYGFTIALRELPSTIENLWGTVREFLTSHTDYLSDDSLADFISDDGLNSYNLCHFWSNFEIADMDFYRDYKYREFFSTLDRAGGFYYERWGDAPVHSIAASLFLNRDELHFFDDIGYTHPPFTHCPSRCSERGLRCSCVSSETFDWQPYSCLHQYFAAQNYSVFAAV